MSVNKLSYSSIKDYFNSSCRSLVLDISLVHIPYELVVLLLQLITAGVPYRQFQRHGGWKSVSANSFNLFNSVMFTFNFTLFLSFPLSGCVHKRTD